MEARVMADTAVPDLVLLKSDRIILAEAGRDGIVDVETPELKRIESVIAVNLAEATRVAENSARTQYHRVDSH
jgi:hypothetical protein